MMKKLVLIVIALFTVMIFNPLQAETKTKTETKPVAEKVSKEDAKKERVNLLLDRVEEIKAIDKSELSSSERKELRKELREIKSELREMGAGIYISGGALLVIILLIILL